jgi:hypothetical protein
MATRDELVEDVKRSLLDPARVVERLGLKGRKSSRGVTILCPVHGEKNPSCSVTPGPDRTLRVRCFSCGWTGDVLHLVAAVHGLDPRSDFRETLATAAEIAGLHDDAAALREGRPAPERVRPPAPPPERERDYPAEAEVAELWATAKPVVEDPAARAMLEARGLNPDTVASLNAARVLLADTHRSRLPSWAWFRGRLTAGAPWTRTGHRLIVPVYDSEGRFRSVRGWLVEPTPNVPKRVPPVGHKASGLVLASHEAVRWLRGKRVTEIVVCEGEPDTLARILVSPGAAVVGVLSGSWHEGFAARVPYGAEIILRTHLDTAGDKYAETVARSVAGRAQVYRLQPEPESESAA